MIIIGCSKRDNKELKSLGVPVNISIRKLMMPIKELDNTYIILEQRTESFRTDILQFVEHYKSKVDDTSLLGRSLAGDIESYDTLTLEPEHWTIRNDSNLYKYGFYIAEKYNYPSIYISVYLEVGGVRVPSSDRKNKNKWSLDYLNDNERNLALYCLLKSYKMREISTAKIISYYFREGYYFPKNIEVANKLDSIYNRAYPPKYRP